MHFAVIRSRNFPSSSPEIETQQQQEKMMQKAEALGCEKPSTTWSGPCLFSDDCNNQCINWEGAVHGECSFALGPECFCYFC
nr:defensin-like protein 1 [Nicotiana tomentosiformis]